MANTKKFVVKNGLQTQNIEFISPDKLQTATISIDNAGVLSLGADRILTEADGGGGGGDAVTLDGLDSTQFLRSDADDYFDSATDSRRLYVTNTGSVVENSLSFSVDTTNSYIRTNNEGATANLQFDIVAGSGTGSDLDLATASYDSVSLNIATNTSGPQSITFVPNGTRFIVADSVQDAIQQYNLSTAYDLTTATHNFTFDVSGVDQGVTGTAFNNDGTKLYFVGNEFDIVRQYSLSTAYDISTATSDGVGLNVSAQNDNPHSVTFNNNGTKVFVAGLDGTNDAIYQYSVSTPYDMSTASYDSVSLDVSAQDTEPTGAQFNSDGTIMFLVGRATSRIYQYNLSTAFDLSTAIYSSKSLDISGTASTPSGIAFNSDYTKLYIVGSLNDTIFQYSLSTTAGTESTGNIVFSHDGTNTSITIDASAVLTQADAGPGNGLDADTVDGIQGASFLRSDAADTVTGQLTFDAPAFFNSVGNSFSFDRDTNTRTHLQFRDNADAVEWAIRTNPSSDLEIVNSNATGNFVLDGDRILTAADLTAFEDANTLDGLDSTDFLRSNVSDTLTAELTVESNLYLTSNTDTRRFYVTNTGSNTESLSFSVDGSNSYIRVSDGSSISTLQLELIATSGGTPAPDVSTTTYDSVSFSVSGQETNALGMVFNDTGSKFYVIGSDTDTIYQYSMSTPFDLSTASYDSVSFDVSAQDSFPYAVNFNNDGTKMYIVGSSSGAVRQYTLSTPYVINTASYDSVSFNVLGQDTVPIDFIFNNDGSKFYIPGVDTATIFQYSMSTPFDLTTASYDSVSLNVNAQTSPRGITFNDTGGKLLVVGNSGSVYQYTMSTPYNLSTATYDNLSFSVSGQDAGPQSVKLSNDNTKLFMLGNATTAIYQYSTTMSGVTAPSTGNILFNHNGTNTTITIDGNRALTTGDEGPGNGIDADTVDGVEAASFLRSDQADTVNNSLTFEAVTFFDSALGLLRFDRDAQTREHIAFYDDVAAKEWDIDTDTSSNLLINNSNATGNLLLDGNRVLTTADSFDGGDAATLDGIDSTQFLRSDVADTASASISFQSSDPTDIRRGTSGSFGDTAGSGTNWGANIWAMGSTYAGAGFGSSFTNTGASSRYGLSWLRSTHPEVDGAVGEGLYIYRNAANIAAIGGTSANFNIPVQANSLTTSGDINSSGDIFVNGNRVLTTVDGTSSDAGTLDGLDSTQFLRSDAETIFDSASDTRRLYVTDTGATSDSLSFSVDLNKSYVRAENSGSIVSLQYDLSAGAGGPGVFPDLSTASYDSASFSFAGQDTSVTGIAFNNAGTRLYMVGAEFDTVFQYSLATDFDATTVAYNSVSFSVSAQESNLRGIDFNDDGTKMYIVGFDSASVHQYTLSTAFDLSTASYDSVSFSVSAQDATPDGVEFGSSGSKMFIVGATNNSIYQYTLSTPYDISTASYDSTAFDVSAQVAALTGVTFSTGGNKMYVVGSTNDTIYQYSLSTLWDVSTATYDVVSVSVGTQAGAPRDIAFSTNSTKLYVTGSVSDSIFQYSVTTAGGPGSTGNVVFSHDGTNTTITVDGSNVLTEASVNDTTRAKYLYNAGASQTVFSGTDSNGSTLVIEADSTVDVFRNGVRLSGDMYTVDAGADSVTVPSATSGDTIEIIVYKFGAAGGGASTDALEDLEILIALGI